MPALAWGMATPIRLPSDSTWLGLLGVKLAPGICPCAIGVPGTLGDRPEGLASGEPPGAKETGGCEPKAGEGVAVPGRLRNSSLARRASAPVSSGDGGLLGKAAGWVCACAVVVLKTPSPVVRAAIE